VYKIGALGVSRQAICFAEILAGVQMLYRNVEVCFVESLAEG
jgi:hypothetical protein